MRTLIALFLLAQTAAAAPPKVVTDIPPVHSLVSLVMGDIAEPSLLLSQSSDPHHASLRPSQAKDLQNADLIIAIGAGLTPWLERAVETLAADATYLELMHIEATLKLEPRPSADFGDHDHAEDHADHEDGDDHDDHAKHDDHDDHDDHAKEEDHDDHEDHHAHDGEHDPHGWLDPENGRIWLTEIATALAAQDPQNAAQYRANADAAAKRLTSLQAEIATALAPLKGKPFVLFHDAFHYFEARYDLNAVAAVTLSDTTDPGVAWLRDLRKLLKSKGVTCLLSNYGTDPKQLVILAQGVEGAKIVPIDMLGISHTPGAGLYENLLSGLSRDLQSCLVD